MPAKWNCLSIATTVLLVSCCSPSRGDPPPPQKITLPKDLPGTATEMSLGLPYVNVYKSSKPMAVPLDPMRNYVSLQVAVTVNPEAFQPGDFWDRFANAVGYQQTDIFGMSVRYGEPLVAGQPDSGLISLYALQKTANGSQPTVSGGDRVSAWQFYGAGESAKFYFTTRAARNVDSTVVKNAIDAAGQIAGVFGTTKLLANVPADLGGAVDTFIGKLQTTNNPYAVSFEIAEEDLTADVTWDIVLSDKPTDVSDDRTWVARATITRAVPDRQSLLGTLDAGGKFPSSTRASDLLVQTIGPKSAPRVMDLVPGDSKWHDPTFASYSDLCGRLDGVLQKGGLNPVDRLAAKWAILSVAQGGATYAGTADDPDMCPSQDDIKYMHATLGLAAPLPIENAIKVTQATRQLLLKRLGQLRVAIQTHGTTISTDLVPDGQTVTIFQAAAVLPSVPQGLDSDYDSGQLAAIFAKLGSNLNLGGYYIGAKNNKLGGQMRFRDDSGQHWIFMTLGADGSLASFQIQNQEFIHDTTI